MLSTVFHKAPQPSRQLGVSYFTNAWHVCLILMHLLTMILHKSLVYKFTANGGKKCQSIICCHGNSWEVQCAKVRNWDGKIQVCSSGFCLLEFSNLEIKVKATPKPKGNAFTFWTDAFH